MACIPENIVVARNAIERSSHCSVCCHSVSLRLSQASVQWILHKDLHFYPYKIQVTHALQVLMTWADGTAQLRYIPNSLQNSRCDPQPS
jgi:hypothetical protein